MPTPPLTNPAPQILLNGSHVPGLTRALKSMIVRVVAGRATAEIEVLGALNPSLPRVEVETTTLAIQLFEGDEAFTGRLIESATRMAPAALSTVLYAEGTAPDGRSGPTVALRYGAEIESGLVRHPAGRSTARCETGTVGLRRGSRVCLSSPDPEFDGEFEVVELWHRYDARRGLRTEFVASAWPGSARVRTRSDH